MQCVALRLRLRRRGRARRQQRLQHHHAAPAAIACSQMLHTRWKLAGGAAPDVVLRHASVRKTSHAPEQAHWQDGRGAGAASPGVRSQQSRLFDASYPRD
eukprot:240341-Chlamydomonas_euryale.AAC.16